MASKVGTGIATGIAILALSLVIMGLSAAEVPSLVGTWNGTWSGYSEGKGYVDDLRDGSINWVVSEQNGRIFSGNLTDLFRDNATNKKGFAGIINLDNKTFYISEFGKGSDNGYTIGTIISNDEIELEYIQDGETGFVAIDRLHRVN